MADLCTATSKRTGQPCRNKPMRGQTVCKQHSGHPDVGRPSRLDEDVTTRIVILIRNGNYQATAARASGIGETTFYSWMERGEADHEAGLATEHAEFWKACTRAKAEAEASALQKIELAAATDWRAAAWRLERQYPDRYGQRGRFEHAHSGRIRSEQVEVPNDQARLVEVAQILGQVGALPESEAA